MTHKIQIQVLSNVEVISTAEIVAVSKISAEDRARRYFRKNAVPMANVTREAVSEDEQCWTGYAAGLPEGKAPVRRGSKAKAPKMTAMQVYQAVVDELDKIYVQWKTEKQSENAEAHWQTYQAMVKDLLKEKGAKFVAFTNRPFALIFSLYKVEWTVGRDRSGGFELKEAPAEPVTA